MNGAKVLMTLLIKQRGASLVELIAFIVIVSIAVIGVMISFSAALRGGPTSREMTIATQLAQERMELILAQKRVLGFVCFTVPRFDPCQAAAAAGLCPATAASAQPQCTPPAGYSLMLTPPALTMWAGGGGNPDMQVVTVTVRGPDGIQFTLDSLVTDY